MTIKVELGKIQVGLKGYTDVPYWFTGDGSIHLNASNPSINIDINSASIEVLTQIYLAYMMGELVISDPNAVLRRLENFVDIKPEAKTEASAPITPKESAKITFDSRQTAVIEKAKTLISLPFNSIKKQLISLEDIQVVEMALKLESEKTESRSSVVKLLDKAIRRLTSDQVIIENETMEVTEEKYKDIDLNKLNDLILEQ